MNNITINELITKSRESGLWKIQKTLNRNDLVDSLCSVNDNLYMVEEGVIKVCHVRDGKEAILAFGLEGELVSDLFSFLTGTPSELYLQAIRKTRLIGISRESFNSIIEQDLDFARAYRKTLESKIIEMLQRQTMFFSKSPQQRVEETQKLKILILS